MLTQWLFYALRTMQVASGVAAVILVATAIAAPIRRLGAGSHAEAASAAAVSTTAERASVATVQDYDSIAARDLFAQKVEVKPVVEAPIEPTRLQIRLFGTMSSTRPERSLAVLQNMETRSFDVARVGDSVANGKAKVVRIEPRRVVLDHEGRLEAAGLWTEEESRLALNTRSPRPARTARRPAAPRVDGAGRTIPTRPFKSLIGPSDDRLVNGLMGRQLPGLRRTAPPAQQPPPR